MSQSEKDRRMFLILLANIISAAGTGITIIAITWYLVNREGGEVILGYAAIVFSGILFFLSPYIGVWIDRMSRKRILLACQAFGALLMAPCAAWACLHQNVPTWQLLLIQFGGLLYYAVQMPAMFAFCQEIFDSSQYQKLTSTMEIQSQFATMISGGSASLLVDRWDPSFILGLDALTYVIGLLLLLVIPYESTLGKKDRKRITVWDDMKEGYTYLKEIPQVTLFLICSLLPFIVVMVGNYLNPIYVIQTLRADASVMGIASMVYAAGAVVIGFMVRFLTNRWGLYTASLITYLVFTFSTFLIVAVPTVLIFIAHKFLFGWGNAGTRVVRNTFMMERIPNHVIGRVNSYFNGMGLALRVALIGLSTQLVAFTGARSAFGILAALLIAGFAGMVVSRRAIAARHDSTMET